MIKLCQVELGITVVGDGEMSKPSYVSYVSQRLTGWVYHELVERVFYANGLGKCRQKMGEKNKTFVIKGVGSLSSAIRIFSLLCQFTGGFVFHVFP